MATSGFWEGTGATAPPPVDPKQRLKQLTQAPPGQTPGINPGADQSTDRRDTYQSPDFSPLGQAGQAGQSGQYGGINPGGGTAQPTSASSQPVPYGAPQAAQALDTSPGGAVPPPADQAAQPAQSAQQQQQAAGARWAQKFGRQPNQAEWNRIGAKIGQPAGPNGTYTAEQVAAADAEAEAIAREQGWNGPSSPAPATPAPTTPQTPHTPGPGVPPPTPAPPSAQTPVDQALQQRLLEMLQTNTGDVDTTTQEYQSQLGAFRRGQQRSIEDAKNAAAERANAGGTLHSGGFDAAQTGIDVAAAQGEGDFTAQLAGQQLSRQREDLQQALQLAQQSGLQREANQLQERLAAVDANLRQQGLNLQGELGRGGLDLQRQLGLGDLDLRRLLGQGQLDLGGRDLDLRRLLGLGQLDLGRQQLAQQGTQFGQQLGFNYWNALQNYQNQAIQQLLGGV